MKKHTYRFFTIADYEREAAYLRAMHRQGWKLVKVSLFPFILVIRYSFESCPPQDTVYQLDFYPLNKAEQGPYLQLFADCGWEHITNFNTFSYFRKPVAELESEADDEIYNDAAGKLDMVKRLLAWRFLPALLAFLALSALLWSQFSGWTDQSLLVRLILAVDLALLFYLAGQLCYIGWRFWQKSRQLREE